MRPYSTHQWFQNFIKTYSKSTWIAIDMTVGHGNDTHFLAQHIQHVFGFDIQPNAIQQAQQLTHDYTNITYIIDDHQRVDDYVCQPVDLVVYNLGYFPTGDKSIKTTAHSTICSLNKVYSLLKSSAYLVITCYPKHEGGKQESDAVLKWLDDHQFKTIIHRYTSPLSPFIVIAKK